MRNSAVERSCPAASAAAIFPSSSGRAILHRPQVHRDRASVVLEEDRASARRRTRRGRTSGTLSGMRAAPIDRLRAVNPRVADALIALGLTAALQLQLALGDTPGSAAVNAVAALFLTLPLAWRRSRPLEVAVIFASATLLSELLGGGLFDGDPPVATALLAGAAVFLSLGAHAEERAAVTGAVVGVLAFWATVLVSGEVDVQSFLFSAGLVVATPWLAGRASRSRRLRLESLEREQEQRTRLAVGDERTRIARELHDVVAHSVGVMVVQAGGARRMLERDPARAREALESIEETGRAALTEMRHSIGVLRDEDEAAALEPQPGMENLGDLVERAREGGLTVDLALEGEARPLPRGVDLSAYRIVQEALTNTIKHAGPVRTRVNVRYGERELELEVADEGPVQATNGTGAGHGLVGMRERVASYGGRLRAGPRPEGGFVVHASLPLGT
jgi:signal transduction histidine kinase